MADSLLFCEVQAALILCFLLSEGVRASEWCGTSHLKTYCAYGCCGSLEHYCCTLDVALIVGCVVGGFITLCVVITVVCCYMKKQGYRGRVVGPRTVPGATAGVTVVNSNNMTYATAPQPPYPGYLAPYPQPPPPYAYSNPAYPPPAHSGMAAGPQPPVGFAAPAAPAYAPVAS